MKTYRRITWTDRLVIEKLYNSGLSYATVAKRTGFAVSSVYVEIQRGLYTHQGAECTRRPLHYSAQIAEDAALWLASGKGCPLKLGKHHAYAQVVASRILAGESPDQIVGDLRNRGEWTVSTVTLYRYIDQGYIPGVTNKNLVMKSRRKRPYHKVKRASRPPAGTSIERRPEDISGRSTFGHWELDTVIGKAKGTGQAVMVLTERLTRYEVIVKLSAKSPRAVVPALFKIAARFPSGTFQSITCDNGSEFADCEGMERVAPVYYCHPYSSWERGSNENANKIIRRFFPKGQSMARRTQKDCDAAAHFLNHMHRKSLGYATANELFQKYLAQLS